MYSCSSENANCDGSTAKMRVRDGYCGLSSVASNRPHPHRTDCTFAHGEGAVACKPTLSCMLHGDGAVSSRSRISEYVRDTEGYARRVYAICV